MNKKVSLFFLFLFLATYYVSGFTLQKYVTSTGPLDIIELNNENEMLLDAGRLSFGCYGLRIWLDPHDGYLFREIEEVIQLEFLLILKQGEKLIEKKITKIIDNGTLGFETVIFKVPRDFQWNHNLIIYIKDISVEDSVKKYYKNIDFIIMRQGFPQWI